MAEQIRQEFVIDAADALRDLEALMTKFKALSDSLGSYTRTATEFNRSAGKVVRALTKIKEEAKGAANQLARVSKYRGIVPRAAPTGATTTRGTGVDPSATKKAAASLEELRAAARKVFSGAAIQNQKAFNVGLNELVAGFHRTGGTVDEFKEKIKKLDERINGSKARMTAAIRAIGKSTKKNLNTKPLQTFTVSWKTMLRIVTTQLIVRALNQLKQAFREAIVDGIAFQRAIAEIGTIANDAYGSLADIAKIVRETSDEFGKGRLDVAEGLYQTLSNQVGNAAESLHVFEVATKLSIAAVSTTEDSVNLLTAALNSFDISVVDSELVAAKLFRTIELGRTRVGELASTFGRIGPLAHSLGVSLDETLAAITVITVQGTRTAEALTQVRGVMQAMLKPSDNMKKSFKEMGVANAEQLIAMYGFQGALLELQKTTGTTSSEMGKLIRRVRGLLGAITLASQDAETFVDNLQDIQKVTAALLEKKYKLVFETPGEKLLREWNKLKNILVVDIGSALIDVANSTIKWTKTLYSAGKSVAYFAAVLSGVLIPLMIRQAVLMKAQIGLWVANSAKIMLARSATLAFAAASIKAAIASAAAWGAALLPLTAIVAIVGLFAYNLKKAQDRIIEASKATREYINEVTKLKKVLTGRWLSDHFSLQQKINQLNASDTLKRIAAVQRAYQKQADIVAETNTKEIEGTKAKFKNILNALEEYQSEYENVATDAADAIIASQDRVYDINKTGEEAKYDRSLRFLDSQDKIYAQQKRITALNREAQGLLATGDPEQIERGLALYTDAEKIVGNINKLAYDQLAPLEAARKVGKLSAEDMTRLTKARIFDNQALKLSNNLTNARIVAEKKLQAIEKEKQRIAEERAKTLEKLNTQFQSEFDIIFDNMKQFDKDNKRLTTEELQKQAAARARAFVNIRNLAKEIPDFDYEDFFGLAQLSSELNNMLSDKELTISEESINQMGESIAQGFADYMGPAMKTQIEEISRIFGIEFDPTRGFKDLSDALVEDTKEAEKLNNAYKELIKSRKDLEAEEVKLQALRQQADIIKPTWGARISGAPKEVLALIDKFTQGQELSTKETARLEDKLIQVGNAWGSINDEAETHYRTLLAQAERIKVERARAAEAETVYAKIDPTGARVKIEAALKAAADGRIDTLSRMDAIRAVENITITETTTLVKELARLEKARYTDSTAALKTYTEAQAASWELQKKQLAWERQQGTIDKSGVQIKQLGGLIQGYAKGGLIKKLLYLAKGNLARGTDTIPAMLSPGEFVMNSKSTRQFFSQLVAMNSGRSPIFRQDGGSVTNVTVGDVNINGDGGKTSAHQQGRQVVAVIKRELRRGTSSF